MGSPKNSKFLLTPAETLAFKKELKEITTQRAFAATACVTQETVSKTITGNRVPKIWRELLVLKKENTALKARIESMIAKIKEFDNV